MYYNKFVGCDSSYLLQVVVCVKHYTFFFSFLRILFSKMEVKCYKLKKIKNIAKNPQLVQLLSLPLDLIVIFRCVAQVGLACVSRTPF